MKGSVPLAAFDDCSHGVLVSSRNGRVSFCNRAARLLLGSEAACPVGMRCWEVARLRTLEGEPFCKPNCIVQLHQQQSRSWPLHVVTPVSSNLEAPRLHLLSFFLPDRGPNRQAVLHVLVPQYCRLESSPEINRAPIAIANMRRLSRRETDVLRLMASGLSTSEIAASLFISPVTVRNHVQRTLLKLGVHRRLEAVLAWLHSRSAAEDLSSSRRRKE